MAVLGIRDDSFELLSDDRSFGRRRELDGEAVSVLEGVSSRYDRLLDAGKGEARAGLLDLGRDLFAWLDGDASALGELLNQTVPPLHFEIRCMGMYPSPSEWALLKAPWELLADADGFLAEDARLRFSPYRRIGRPAAAGDPGKLRLGLVFMAAAPRGGQELDYEAEEVAILKAVGDRGIDLLVEESGTAEGLVERLGEYQAMQVLHLSCHGHNALLERGELEAKAKPVLMLEDDEGNEKITSAAALLEELGDKAPPLVFLSACLSAAESDGAERAGGNSGAKRVEGGGSSGGRRSLIAHSFATELVSGVNRRGMLTPDRRPILTP